MDNKKINNFIFHDNISSISTGNVLDIDAETSTVTIEFNISNGGTFSATFETQGSSGNWYPVIGINIANLATSTKATTATSLYQISAIGLQKLRINITSLTGSLTVYGNARG